MSTVELDRVDRGIIHLLQADARRKTAEEMGDAVGVSASTVRNRIDRLESTGVIRGYNPDIDYERAGYQHQMVLICHAPMGSRKMVAQRVMDVEGVVTVREMLTGSANLHVEAIGADSDAVDRITDELADLDLEIKSVELVKDLRVQPFDGFGSDIVEE